MNLYMTLAPTRSRQILAENGWPETVSVRPDTLCYCFRVSGRLTADTIIELLPALASRGRLDARVVPDMLQQCKALDLRARITGEILKGEPSLHVTFAGEEVLNSGLIDALTADLMSLCRQIFTDASIIADMTGAQFEGANIFERQTRNFWVVAEPWNELPPLMRPDLEQQQLWLSEIFEHGASVIAVGLAIFRDFGMIREGEYHAGICVIRPGAPVRRWLPLKALNALANEVRQRIIYDRELTSSFS